jgi:hypothetical protein
MKKLSASAALPRVNCLAERLPKSDASFANRSALYWGVIFWSAVSFVLALTTFYGFSQSTE